MQSAFDIRLLQLDDQVDIPRHSGISVRVNRESIDHEIANLGVIERPHDRVDTPEFHPAK
jgi:hypothetical protein